MSEAMIKVSLALQDEAREIDRRLEAVAGQRVSFSLFVWTEGRAQYVSNSSDRQTIKTVLTSITDGWDAGMPDIPAHKVE